MNILIGCGELVEVQSVFSIRPLIGELDMEMIRNMGLCNLEPFGRTEELEMINCLTSTTRTCPLQGLYECGIFSIFLHGSMIPNWYKYRGETALSIIVPSHPKLKIKGLNVCVVYTRDCVVHKFALYISLFLKVSNEAKGLMWSYSPVSVGRPKENEEMSWLSHWQFENDELEGGEELCFSVDTEDVRFLIKEIGVQLVYEHENEGKACIQSSIPEDVTTQHEAPSWSQGVLIEHVAAPKYQIWPGKYFLCNHYSFPGRFDFSKAYPMGGYRRILEHQDFEKRVLGQKNLL